MIFKRLFSRKTDTAQALYEAIVAAARQPIFYADWNVPDTVDGRFEMIILHVHLLMERLRGQTAAAEDMRQKLVDTFFLDMDRSLREMGVGDLSVGKKVRKMSEAFYGRVLAYTKAGDNEVALADALSRNVFAEVENADVKALGQWMIATQKHLLDIPLEQLLGGKVHFSKPGETP
jgi:cytochrome b pre-mRNA-processing protein 3